MTQTGHWIQVNAEGVGYASSSTANGVLTIVHSSWNTRWSNADPSILPREFSSVIMISVYIPPQDKKNNKLALNKLYKAINKKEYISAEQFNRRFHICNH